MTPVVHRSPGETFAGWTDLTVETCCNCGVMFAFPKEMERARRNDHASFYCPHGHGQHYTAESDKEKLKREREYRAAEEARRERIEASERAQKAAALRARNERDKVVRRVAHGVCPCCNRTFKQLAAHMKRKHPDYQEAADGTK